MYSYNPIKNTTFSKTFDSIDYFNKFYAYDSNRVLLKRNRIITPGGVTHKGFSFYDGNYFTQIKNKDTTAFESDLFFIDQEPYVKLFKPDNSPASSDTFLVGKINVQANEIKYLDNPDNGCGGLIRENFNGKGYLIYKNAQNKYQLGYIDDSANTPAIINYTANRQSANNININWENSSHLVIDKFKLYRSINNGNFDQIAVVDKQCCKYNYMDRPFVNSEPEQATIKYKLDMVDFEYNVLKSQTKTIEIKKTIIPIPQPNPTPPPVAIVEDYFKIYPNPAKSFITIKSKGLKKIKIYDVLGKIVRSNVYENNLIEQSMQVSLSNGVYIVKAWLNNGEVNIEKLLVE